MTFIFHKIDQKTFNGIISSLHFTTLIHIPDRPIKGGDILDF